MPTSHADDAEPAEGVTFLSCDVAEAARIGLEAAQGKNLEVLSPTIRLQQPEAAEPVASVNLRYRPVRQD